MKLCDYGCGREAKFPLKNGKWCCSANWTQCPSSRKKNSTQMKKEWEDPNSKFNSTLYREKKSNNMKESYKDPNSIFNSISCREKRSKKMKELWEDPNSIFNSKLYKENHSNGMEKVWEDSNSVFNSDLYREKQSINMKNLHKDPDSKFNSDSYKEKRSKIMTEFWKDPDSQYNSILCKEKLGKSLRLKIEQINERYPFFSKIEEMRYNPDKPNEKEIQVHCKNHNCKNSKEKGGWFTPTYSQLYERISTVENPRGFGESNFYCSQHCKDTCPLYNLHGDPYKENNLPYTYAEYLTCRAVVFERENTLCEYCGEPATDMHHIFPVKIAPFFALDPDYCVACCEKHHYKYAHKDECSTGNLAKIVCSVESQKFLNQKIGDA